MQEKKEMEMKGRGGEDMPIESGGERRPKARGGREGQAGLRREGESSGRGRGRGRTKE